MPSLTDQEWITGVILGAASASPSLKNEFRGTLTHPDGVSYRIGRKVATATNYTLYECLLPDTRGALLKITTTPLNNVQLENEAHVLPQLQTQAEAIEALRDQHRTPHAYNYQYFFPKLEATFIAPSQANRRVNILSFPSAIETVNQLTPCSLIISKGQIDPRTSAWILGKLLKTMAFAHDLGFANHNVTASNILLEIELHGLVIFDWSSAAPVHPSAVQADLNQAALLVYQLLGGNPDTQQLPTHPQLTDDRFLKMLQKISSGVFSSASRAHHEFYELIWRLWPRQFHPFTYVQGDIQ